MILFLIQIIICVLQAAQEVTLELTDDTWSTRDENAQTVSKKQQSSKYMHIQKKVWTLLGFSYWTTLINYCQCLQSRSCGCTTATFGCSFLIGCSSCATNGQSRGEKYCFFHSTQFTGPWVGTWRYVYIVVSIMSRRLVKH